MAAIHALACALLCYGGYLWREEGKQQRKGKTVKGKVVAGRGEAILPGRQGWWQNRSQRVQSEEEKGGMCARRKSRSRSTCREKGMRTAMGGEGAILTHEKRNNPLSELLAERL